ncbi:GNAT family N-acetyltransferase [Paenibacillus sp. RC84]|uniref:GNAT family N-acetyltransferase n=1 Tax=Paenibacillus sp. RC84 TaxID=3156252 RepID=UPI0035122B8D
MNTSLTLRIRRASLEDIGELVELRKILLSRGEGHYVSRSAEEDLAWQSEYRNWLRANLKGNDRILVAAGSLDDEERICACAIGIIDDRAPMKGCLNGKVGWIQTVVVHPDKRRHGLGEGIMNYVLSWFRANEVGKVTLQTTPSAKRLYENLGFSESGEDLLIKEF